MFRLLAKLCLTAIVFICPASASEAAKRVALVIGNSAYSHAERLTNPLNDASKLAAKLKDIGFGTVTLKLDQSYNELRRSLRAFSKEAAGADIALLYFAGHGMEVGGTNYVIPTDAKLSHVDDVEYEAIELSKVIGALSRANKLKIVILDACRNNPFKASMATENTHRSMGRGLARVSPAGSDTLVAYAAKEGTIAADGDGEHSPYTRALLKHIGTGGLDVRLLFGRVRDDVLAATGRKQEPFTYGSLSGQRLALVPESAGSHTPSPAQRPVTSAVDRSSVLGQCAEQQLDPGFADLSRQIPRRRVFCACTGQN